MTIFYRQYSTTVHSSPTRQKNDWAAHQDL